ncbi:MAG: hypothetical protein ACK4SY_10725, partial [Pyrobaculum sp.]
MGRPINLIDGTIAAVSPTELASAIRAEKKPEPTKVTDQNQRTTTTTTTAARPVDYVVGPPQPPKTTTTPTTTTNQQTTTTTTTGQRSGTTTTNQQKTTTQETTKATTGTTTSVARPVDYVVGQPSQQQMPKSFTPPQPKTETRPQTQTTTTTAARPVDYIVGQPSPPQPTPQTDKLERAQERVEKATAAMPELNKNVGGQRSGPAMGRPINLIDGTIAAVSPT